MPEVVTKVKIETEEQKEAKRKLSAGMKITVKNDSKKDIEISLKGELNAVKVGSSISGVKADFFPSDLYKVGRIKGVNIVTDSKSGSGEVPKKNKTEAEDLKKLRTENERMQKETAKKEEADAEEREKLRADNERLHNEAKEKETERKEEARKAKAEIDAKDAELKAKEDAEKQQKASKK